MASVDEEYDPVKLAGMARKDIKEDGSEIGRCGTIQNRMITGLELFFNAAGQRKYNKQARQLQYVEMASDGEEDGLAADGRSFSVLFSGFTVQRLTIRGRNLQRYFTAMKNHRLESLRAIDMARDFEESKDPVVTDIQIEMIKIDD